MLRVKRSALDEMIAVAYRSYPYECCGVIAGPDGGFTPGVDAVAERFYACRNAAASARVYTIDPSDHLRAERDADDADLEINGAVHSHTHTEPYPSPTDIAQAPDPGWHYVIIGLKREVPEVRSYRIVDGVVTEERLEIID
jgi:proteasome lid subunit RPN8/RPN11